MNIIDSKDVGEVLKPGENTIGTWTEPSFRNFKKLGKKKPHLFSRNCLSSVEKG